MAGNRYRTIKDMFEMVDWSPQEEKCMLEMLIDYSLGGKLFGAEVQSIALNEIKCALSKTFHKKISLMKVKKKFDSFKSTYELWNVVSMWYGVLFNTTENKYEASASTWETILKEHPKAKKYMFGGEKLWCELLLIFGDQTLQAISLTPTCSRGKTVEVIEISDDHDNGENVLVGRTPFIGKRKNAATRGWGGSPISIMYATKKALVENFMKDVKYMEDINKMERFEAKNGSASSHQSSTGSSPWPGN